MSASEDGTVRLWDIRQKLSAVRLLKIPGVGEVGFCKSSSDLVTVSCGNHLFGYDLRSSESIIVSAPSFSVRIPEEDDIDDFSFSSSGDLIAVPSDAGEVHLISSKTFTVQSSVSVHDNIASVARFLPCGDQIVSGGYDCKIATCRFGSTSLRADKSFPVASLIPLDEDSETVSGQSINPPFVTSMEVSPDAHQLAVGVGDGSVLVLDLHRGGSRIDTRRIAWGGAQIHPVSVASLAWDERSSSIWSVGNDSVLQKMDANRISVRYPLGFKPNAVVSFGSDTVAVGGLLNEIEILAFS